MNGVLKVFKTCMVFMITLQLTASFLPFGNAGAMSARSLFCNLTGEAPSAQAQAHLQKIFELAGKDWPDDPDAPAPGEHCPNCLITIAPTLTAEFVFEPILRTAPRGAVFLSRPAGFFYTAHGPPLGGRAPPYFL